ncbi:GAF domain-containing protein [Krasilnikovia cinnamomea]|uniref:GAF domain-containing protein n=1 Tax=Krasilnikovia cinnamomea TaxID=349313 RepID=A0A4Q7ZTT9_9ACTN|nr:GAF domain-containing SpoIIE family protein phosphatase [Krasilnikovia cinnamomea]RZU54023.1 GAF domain-containing protein [Krasilnikovia cinnamomea]
MGQGLRDDERLRRLEAVTDATLSRLEVSDMLDELLERVRDLLNTDTATILLVDPHSQQLVATAAKGLEEEVRQGVRIPIGRGFAGRIAQTRQPALLAELTRDDVFNPILIEKGLRSLLGVPIFVGGEVIGVLHVGTMSHREFTDEDLSLLQLAADRAAVAGQIRSRKVEQTAALALQRSLIPPTLPRIDGLALAARYVPGHEFGIGGDWYDVFALPSGWLGVVIGDVAGHGLASAVVMGRVRSALRAYSLLTCDPGEVLTMLDRKVRHFEAGSLTTACYVMISPDRGTLLLSTAGHVLPVLAAPDGPTTLIDAPVDPPLGVGRTDGGRHTTSLELPPGGLLVCYTDGLVERRGEVIDVGLNALVDVVKADDPESVCRTIMNVIGLTKPTDDIALLAIRRDPDDA